MFDSKKYVLTCIAVAGFFIIFVVAFNWWQDPTGIFGNDETYQEVAKASCEGKRLVVSGNYNERLFKKSIINNGDNRYDVLVLGSSRVMSIGEEDVPAGFKLRSLAVSGAGLEDDIAIWHDYVEHMSAIPKTVIIGADPWLLNRNNGDKRWQKGLVEDYSAGMKTLGLNIDNSMDYTLYYSLISLKYTKESFKKFLNPRPTLDIWDSSKNSDEDRQLIYGDGSIMYSHKEIGDDADKKAKSYLSGKIYQVEAYDELDEQYREMFEALVNDIQKRGIKVIIFLPPYHPMVYDYLKHDERYKNVFAAEQWFKDFCRENEVTVIGDYNPATMGMMGKDFLDGMHMQRESQGGYLRHTLAERHFWGQ